MRAHVDGCGQLDHAKACALLDELERIRSDVCNLLLHVDAHFTIGNPNHREGMMHVGYDHDLVLTMIDRLKSCKPQHS